MSSSNDSSEAKTGHPAGRPPPVIIDEALLAGLSGRAREHSRLRLNHNFHAGDQAACHQLLNAIEPGSYVPPHRHNDPSKGEAFIVVRGKLAVFFFDDAGAVTGQAVLGPGVEACGVYMASGTWHTVLALEPGTVFFEAKAGPYIPPTPDERASWAPSGEDTAHATAFMGRLIALLQHAGGKA